MRSAYTLKIVINFGESEKISNFAKLKSRFGFSWSEKGRSIRRNDTPELKLRARTNPPEGDRESDSPGAGREPNPPGAGREPNAPGAGRLVGARGL